MFADEQMGLASCDMKFSYSPILLECRILQCLIGYNWPISSRRVPPPHVKVSASCVFAQFSNLKLLSPRARSGDGYLVLRSRLRKRNRPARDSNTCHPWDRTARLVSTLKALLESTCYSLRAWSGPWIRYAASCEDFRRHCFAAAVDCRRCRTILPFAVVAIG
ncbi:hypothetical protein K431DRAFT_80226 [Polychaeton citri CBS 116435]|uniref:Uncharacterized protein n=1 Tax=Polychaeton citri CBS 116435 TaxID=1314669 RepID=A0A9P4QG12_9PEZI|nr:hypothetical protein K431DRAFT_80226 [Polychaeton citri CBS 116435]